MQIVIDIPESMYNFVNTKRPNGCFNEFDKFDTYDISKCVRNGTPLEEISNPCIECSQNCCVCELNGEKCECQKVYVVKENKE